MRIQLNIILEFYLVSDDRIRTDLTVVANPRMRGEAKVEGQLVADADIMSVIADRTAV